MLDVGHAAGALVSVQVAELARLASGPPVEVDAPTDDQERVAHGRAAAPTDDRRAVERGRAPTDAWWRLVLGGPPTPAQRHVLAGSCVENVAGAPFSAHGHLVLRDGRAVAVAACRGVVVEDHLHLSMLTVSPAARHRGHGTALLAAAAAWGRERGARWGVLQVAVHNTAAVALYARSGWTEHHRYRYLIPAA